MLRLCSEGSLRSVRLVLTTAVVTISSKVIVDLHETCRTRSLLGSTIAMQAKLRRPVVRCGMCRALTRRCRLANIYPRPTLLGSARARTHSSAGFMSAAAPLGFHSRVECVISLYSGS